MPPVGPQGSRGGLITAVVVFTIGFVTSTIFAIYYGVALNKAQLDQKQVADRMNLLWNGTNSAAYDQLKSEASSNMKDRTILGAAIQDRADLASVIGGSAAAAKPADALNQARMKLEGIGKRTNTTPPTNLFDALDNVLAVADEKDKDAAAQRAVAVAATAEATKQIQAAKDIQAKAMEQVETANAEKTKAQQIARDYNLNSQKISLTQNQANELTLQKANTELKNKDNQLEAGKKEIATLNRQIDTYKHKLTSLRPHPEENIVRQADGTIMSVASDDIVYINLGRQDHIVPGMTFEVYAKQDGIPRLGDGMTSDSLPVGLGSIEVQLVFSGSSQCRVTKAEVGQHIASGDLIANLIYDRNTKNNFFVYGRFDLGQVGSPSDLDRDKVTGLVLRFGGKMIKQIDIDTDFVVMGAEPKVDAYTPDQLNDPFYVRQKGDQETAVKAYNDIVDQAIKLSIPIMNQNRFLYYCGYYDVAQR
jgi:hypothetical protein